MRTRVGRAIRAVALAATALAAAGCARAPAADPASAASVASALPADSGYLPGAGGARLYYLRVGRGPQAVLIPGRAFLANDFRRLARPERTLVFYDTRNRGRSEALADTAALTVQHDVLDVEAVRRHFGFERAALVGYSYMGLMAVMYAMDHPGRVTRIVQLGPVPRKFGTEYPRGLTAADHPAPYDSAKLAAARELGETRFPVERPREYCELLWSVNRVGLVGDQSRVDALGPGLCDMPNEHPVNFRRHLRFNFASVQRLDIPVEALRRVTVPVLTIHGTWDRNAPYGAGREWALTLPDARLLTVPGAAHNAWVERPDVVLPAVDEFLRGRWPAAAERVTRLDPAER